MQTSQQPPSEKSISSDTKKTDKIVQYLSSCCTTNSKFDFKSYEKILKKQIERKFSFWDRRITTTDKYNQLKKEFLIEQDEKGNTALHYAALLGDTQLLKEFLIEDNRYFVGLEILNNEKLNPVELAIKYRELDQVKQIIQLILLPKIENHDDYDRYYNLSSVHVTGNAIRNDIARIESLELWPVSDHYKDWQQKRWITHHSLELKKTDYQYILYACFLGKIEIVKWLVEQNKFRLGFIYDLAIRGAFPDSFIKNLFALPVFEKLRSTANNKNRVVAPPAVTTQSEATAFATNLFNNPEDYMRFNTADNDPGEKLQIEVIQKIDSLKQIKITNFQEYQITIKNLFFDPRNRYYSPDKNSDLHLAVMLNDEYRVLQMLNMRRSDDSLRWILTAKNNKGETACYTAAALGHFDIFALLYHPHYVNLYYSVTKNKYRADEKKYTGNTNNQNIDLLTIILGKLNSAPMTTHEQQTKVLKHYFDSIRFINPSLSESPVVRADGYEPYLPGCQLAFHNHVIPAKIESKVALSGSAGDDHINLQRFMCWVSANEEKFPGLSSYLKQSIKHSNCSLAFSHRNSNPTYYYTPELFIAFWRDHRNVFVQMYRLLQNSKIRRSYLLELFQQFLSLDSDSQHTREYKNYISLIEISEGGRALNPEQEKQKQDFLAGKTVISNTENTNDAKKDNKTTPQENNTNSAPAVADQKSVAPTPSAPAAAELEVDQAYDNDSKNQNPPGGLVIAKEIPSADSQSSSTPPLPIAPEVVVVAKPILDTHPQPLVIPNEPVDIKIEAASSPCVDSQPKQTSPEATPSIPNQPPADQEMKPISNLGEQKLIVPHLHHVQEANEKPAEVVQKPVAAFASAAAAAGVIETVKNQPEFNSQLQIEGQTTNAIDSSPINQILFALAQAQQMIPRLNNSELVRCQKQTNLLLIELRLQFLKNQVQSLEMQKEILNAPVDDHMKPLVAGNTRFFQRPLQPLAPMEGNRDAAAVAACMPTQAG